jgi:hypothetical protein
MPYRTTAGRSASLSSLDPCSVPDATTYFDQYFPFLKDDDLFSFNVSTFGWFAQADSDNYTFSMSYSDGTAPPTWM